MRGDYLSVETLPQWSKIRAIIRPIAIAPKSRAVRSGPMHWTHGWTSPQILLYFSVVRPDLSCTSSPKELTGPMTGPRL
jgi:hypothetical protein